jgi:hypothetical protein
LILIQSGGERKNMVDFVRRGNRFYWRNRLIGFVTRMAGENVFVAPRIRAKHYFIIHEGFAMNRGVCGWLYKQGNYHIVIRLKDEGDLVSDPHDWLLGTPVHHHKAGFEPQFALAERSMWWFTGDFEKPKKRLPPEQTTLFEEEK